jgi:site-specific DNA recombinase
MATTAAIYCRLSQNRDGTSESNDRQERDCRALAKREGFTVLEAFVDDDRSAYSGRKRPAFDQMLKTLDRFDVLIFWKLDRLVRRTTQFWKVHEACEKAAVRMVSVMEQLDTSTPIGGGIAGMLASVGEQESYNNAMRVNGQQDDAAARGKPHGGRRAFGYEKDGLTIVEAEAKLIKEARDRLLRGEGLHAIASDWNRRGIVPTTADAWRVTTLRGMITNARIAGLRQRKGVVVREALWSAIISPDDRDAIIAMISVNKKPFSGRRPEYLLTSMLTCSGCGGLLRSTVNGTKRAWNCRKTAGEEDRCGTISITAAPVEDLVTDLVLRRLESKSVVKAMTRPRARGTSHKERDDLERRLVQLGRDQDAGLISRAEWLARRGPLQERLDAAQAIVDRDAGTTALARFAGRDPRKLWGTLTLDEKRAILRVLIERVDVAPGVRGVRAVDPGRLHVQWKQSAGR